MAEFLAAKKVGFLAVLSDADLHELLMNAARVSFRKDQEILAQRLTDSVVWGGLLREGHRTDAH